MRMPAPILSAVAATLLVAAPARARDRVNVLPGDNAEESAKKVKELQKERIATLKELADQLDKLVLNARVSFEEALEARLLLLQAELDAAEKESDRLALYTRTVDTLKEYEKVAEARVQAGRGNGATALKIKARRLEVEIQLERAKAKGAKESK